MPQAPRKKPPTTAPDTDRRRSQSRDTLLDYPDAVTRVGKDGRHLFANPAFEDVIGLPAAEIVGKTMQELPVPPRQRKYWLELVKTVFESGKALDVEESFEGPAGLHYYEGRLVPEFDERGDVASVLLVIRDATERHQAIQSLRDSEERFRVTFEKAPIALLLVDRDASISAGNAAACALLGYPEKELAGKTIYEITHPDDLELTRDVAERIFEQAEPTAALEKRYLHKDGEVVWGRVSVSSVRDSEQRFIHNIVQIIDITELRQVEQSLHEREELQRLVIEHANDVIAVIGLDFDIRLVSQSVRDALDYEPEELVGHNVEELVDSESDRGAPCRCEGGSRR